MMKNKKKRKPSSVSTPVLSMAQCRYSVFIEAH